MYHCKQHVCGYVCERELYGLCFVMLWGGGGGMRVSNRFNFLPNTRRV